MEIGGKRSAAASRAGSPARLHFRALVGNGVGGEDAHQAAHGVAAVERALRTAHHIDAVNTLEVEVVGRLVDIGHIVHIEAHGRRVHARTDAADVAGRGDAAAVVGHVEVRRKGGEVLDVLHAAELEMAGAEERGAEWLATQLRRFFRRGHHYGLFNVERLQGVGRQR